jgi:hypothetical protein
MTSQIKGIQSSKESILRSELKIDFKSKEVNRDKENFHIMIKGSIQEKK